jgi:hypothetical protein
LLFRFVWVISPFRMNSDLGKVIAAIATRVAHDDQSLTKTKLLKLLYLFDIEYYRSHRRTFTGFQWEFYHLGPWTREYDCVLASLVDQGLLSESTSNSLDFDTHFYRATEPVDVSGLFSDYGDERILRILLNAWAGRSTPEILDYVYFHTEPMLEGERFRPLDFSCVSEQPRPRYETSSSGASAKEVREMRKRFECLRAARQAGKPVVRTIPPRYDETYLEALAIMDQTED